MTYRTRIPKCLLTGDHMRPTKALVTFTPAPLFALFPFVVCLQPTLRCYDSFL